MGRRGALDVVLLLSAGVFLARAGCPLQRTAGFVASHGPRGSPPLTGASSSIQMWPGAALRGAPTLASPRLAARAGRARGAARFLGCAVDQGQQTLAELAVGVLVEEDPKRKIELSKAASDAWQKGSVSAIGSAYPPDRPGRPPWVEVVGWQKTAKRGKTLENMNTRLSLLHSIAHIESYAIDLTWDLVARFDGMPKEFYDDWVQVAKEETLHFGMLSDRLKELDSSYGALPTHDGLWKAAALTSHDLKARLAIVHMVHEARGVDVTPSTINKFRSAKDEKTAKVLERIYVDELTHVEKGLKWFKYLSEREGHPEPHNLFKEVVFEHFGYLKGPFNSDGRGKAGMGEEWYVPLVKGFDGEEPTHKGPSPSPF
mmetsp:Transcript_56751/g.139268  ORF Transcript_56751/g.139268 Transcript_56751/m.139268 type:complete len:372 (+) Transcript_56751:108-1223(+)